MDRNCSRQLFKRKLLHIFIPCDLIKGVFDKFVQIYTAQTVQCIRRIFSMETWTYFRYTTRMDSRGNANSSPEICNSTSAILVGSIWMINTTIKQENTNGRQMPEILNTRQDWKSKFKGEKTLINIGHRYITYRLFYIYIIEQEIKKVGGLYCWARLCVGQLGFVCSGSQPLENVVASFAPNKSSKP